MVPAALSLRASLKLILLGQRLFSHDGAEFNSCKRTVLLFALARDPARLGQEHLPSLGFCIPHEWERLVPDITGSIIQD